MNKKLYLLRHGKSDWSQPVSDFNRPLSPRGVREAEKVGKWLSENSHVPDLLISSPARRASDTALFVQEASHGRLSVTYDDGLYLADSHTLLETVRETDESVSGLMLVGHNPGMEDLLLGLAGKAMPLAGLVKVLPTATLVCLLIEGAWADASGRSTSLDFRIRGKLLPAQPL